jgi:glyoxylase-like metal-dependent hydrolase (beta-lactamase superfamily II)
MSRNGTEVAESVHRLTNGVSNFYLIEENGKLVLVDAGAPKDWARLTRAVTGLGRRIADLDAVILTHAHSDHTGFAEQARTTAGAQVWVPAPDSDMATTGKAGPREGKATTYLLRPAFYRTLWILTLGGATKIIPVQEVSTFGDGETLDVPGRPRAVHAPGHTPGSAALFFESRRTLLTGDVLVTHNPLTGRHGPQIMPSGLNSDSAQALRSLDNLAGITADVLLAGHGEPWTDGVAAAVSRAKAAGTS